MATIVSKFKRFWRLVKFWKPGEIMEKILMPGKRMVPGEILEDLFAYLSRDALDHCEIICLKWSKVIETSKRLTQRRIIRLESYSYHDDPNECFCVELKSSTGKTISIVDDPNQQELPEFRFFKNVIIGKTISIVDNPNQQKLSAFQFFENVIIGKTISIVDNPYQQELPAFRVFKNVIIDKLIVRHLYDIDFLEKLWMKIFKLAGERIIVKSVGLYSSYIKIENIMLKRLHDLFTKYIEADEITMSFNCTEHEDGEDELLFNKESWKYFDFGKKTEFNFHYYSYILPKYFSNDTFKEFISGKHMEHTKLNELKIRFYRIDRHVIFRLIVEAFCNTDEPLKFFKSIKTLCTLNFDEFVSKFKFVRRFPPVRKYGNPVTYRLSHPKLKWALESSPFEDYWKLHYPNDLYSLKLKSIEL